MGSKCMCLCLYKCVAHTEESEALGEMAPETAAQFTPCFGCGVGICLAVG
jgi:hypothetical protein